jgi:hypothetical protein
LHQIYTGRLCCGKGFGKRDNTDLRTIETDQPNFAGANVFIHQYPLIFVCCLAANGLDLAFDCQFSS